MYKEHKKSMFCFFIYKRIISIRSINKSSTEQKEKLKHLEILRDYILQCTMYYKQLY